MSANRSLVTSPAARAIAWRPTAVVAAVSVWVMTACASSAASGSQSSLAGAASSSMIVQGGDLNQTGRSINTMNGPVSSKVEIPLPMAEAWKRLEAAYAALGVKLTDHHEVQHLIGNSSFKARRKVGDIPLMKALDCGGATSAPNSETYDINMGLRSQLTTNAQGRVLLETFVEGVGTNPLTNNMVPVRCSTMGLFESRIVEMVTTGVTGGAKK